MSRSGSSPSSLSTAGGSGVCATESLDASRDLIRDGGLDLVSGEDRNEDPCLALVDDARPRALDDDCSAVIEDITAWV